MGKLYYSSPLPIGVHGWAGSALAHDMGHTGQNNVFHMNCMSTTAIRYNDKSVLEQNSAAMFFTIVTKHILLSEFLTPAVSVLDI
jgi:hypothetical protein